MSNNDHKAPHDAEKAMDQLMDANRIRSETRMFPEGTKPEAVTQETAAEVVKKVGAYRDRTGRTYASIARSIGVASSTLSAVLKGSYPGRWQEVILDLDRWLDGEVKHEAAPKPAEFVMTTVAQEIMTIADAACTLRTIGLVYGPDSSGIGKTITLRAIAAEKPGSLLITIAKPRSARSSPSGILRQIADAMHLKGAYGSGIGSYLFEHIVEKLKDTPRLLMIDQIHSLCDVRPDDAPFFTLMDLYDATNSPQLWCGTRDIVAYLNRRIGQGKETLAQIRRRICPQRDLMARTRGDGGDPLYTLDEIRQVFAKNKIRLAPDAAQYLMRLANVPDSGALGMCVNLVRMATILVERKGATVLTAEHLRQAFRFLVADEACQLVEAQMDQERQRPLAKLA